MQSIIGNETLKHALFSAVKEKRMAGCYLIEGADGTGKLTVARHAAAALCCSSPNADGSPCLSCHSCRNIMIGNYIDVIEIRPEEEGKRISVSQIREMLRFTHVTSTEGDWRIFIIDDSQNMKKEAQNALLKSIEEPGWQTVFFLLTNDKTKLLPTVRSRAVTLRTAPLTAEQMQAALAHESLTEDTLEEIVLLSSGSLGKAKKLINDEAARALRQLVLSYFRAIMDGAGFTKLCLILPPASTNRKDLALLLPMMKSALRDLICTLAIPGTKPEFFTDHRFLNDLASILSPSRAVELFQMCDQLLLSTEQNVNLFSALSGFHMIAQNLTKE